MEIDKEDFQKPFVVYKLKQVSDTFILLFLYCIRTKCHKTDTDKMPQDKIPWDRMRNIDITKVQRWTKTEVPYGIIRMQAVA